MTQYLKKPIPVDAYKFDGAMPEWPEWPYWVIDAFDTGRIVSTSDPNVYRIRTTEGTLNLHRGQWVLRAPADGRIWPVDDDYFMNNYDEAR